MLRILLATHLPEFWENFSRMKGVSKETLKNQYNESQGTIVYDTLPEEKENESDEIIEAFKNAGILAYVRNI